MSRRIPLWALVSGVSVVMIVLRQDPWFARDGRLLFGVLPVELAWQVGVSLLAVGVLAWLVRVAWPAGLEELQDRDR